MKSYEVVERLKMLREKVNFAARHMSRIIGKTDGYITQLEHNNISLSMDIFLKILEVYGLTPAQFFSSKLEEALSNADFTRRLKLKLYALYDKKHTR